MTDRIPDFLARIADALERMSPPAPDLAPLSDGWAFQLQSHAGGLALAAHTRFAPLDMLLEIDRQKAALLANTIQFAAGAPANNALLWGSRGVGKSALVKAVCAEVARQEPRLRLIEIPRDSLVELPALERALAKTEHRAVLFIDDLSFDGADDAVKALKPVLDGGLGATSSVVVYATSNRRHLVMRDARENSEQDLMWRDTAEERLALSDRFGLWLGFHPLDQDGFLRIVFSYASRLGLPIAAEDLRLRALQWSLERGARSGRTAWQLILALAGEHGRSAAL